MNSDHHTTENERLLRQRLDMWLWVSRFYKTRKQAAISVIAGHIRVNGYKGKPGKLIKIGDQLTILKNQQRFCIKISGISVRRQSAVLAQSIYIESELNREHREQHMLLQKNRRAGLRYDHNKPNKRDRQRMVEIKQQLPKNH